jgi:predicted CoA-binding protein
MTPGRSLSSLADVEPVLRACRVVAVIGAHSEPSRPAHYVPAYLHARGRTILPVNVRLAGQTLFGHVVVDRCDAVTQNGSVAVDVVDVFRRSEDVAGHVDEILAMRPLPKTVWLQSGIENADACARFRAAGIDTVEDRCMLADGRALGL